MQDTETQSIREYSYLGRKFRCQKAITAVIRDGMMGDYISESRDLICEEDRLDSFICAVALKK